MPGTTGSSAYRRALRGGLVASVVAHVLALWTPAREAAPTGGGGAAAAAHATPFVGLRVVRLREHRPAADASGPVSSREPVVAPSPARRAPREGPAVIPGPGAAARTLGASPSSPGSEPPRRAADALGPALGDGRLWARREGAPARDWAREEFVLAWRIVREMRASAQRPRATPGMSRWVGGGGRAGWGVSPGRLRLGSVTVPVCGGAGADAAECGFGLLPHRRQAYAAWRRAYADISLQARRFDLDAELRARALAIRARRDAERSDPPGGRR